MISADKCGCDHTPEGADAKGTPPRWATSEGDSKRIIFLVLMPRVDEAHAWAETQRKGPTGGNSANFSHMLWALTIAAEDRRNVYGFYDQMPDDARLTGDMKAALEGRTPIFLSYNVKEHAADLDRVLSPLTWTVLASKAKTTPTDAVAPDGRAFIAAPDWSAKAGPSRLTCPAVTSGYVRTALAVTGPADGTQEVGCRYAGDGGRMSVFATHIPASNLHDVMTLMLADEMADSDGQPSQVPSLTSPAGSPGASVFFKTRDGFRKGLSVVQRGDWYYATYALYAPGGETAINTVAAALLAGIPAP